MSKSKKQPQKKAVPSAEEILTEDQIKAKKLEEAKKLLAEQEAAELKETERLINEILTSRKHGLTVQYAGIGSNFQFDIKVVKA
jgi:hypothetical protein